MSRPVQYFTEEYLRRCAEMTPLQIVEFLEGFRSIATGSQSEEKSILISMKVPPSLLAAFKAKAKAENISYQTQIKKLMQEWLLADDLRRAV